MAHPAIKIEGLWKEYTIGGSDRRPRETFREMIVEVLSAPLRRLRGSNDHDAAERQFWALKDVNFEVHAGQVVGIIGRNGAGKSTLLKILSRITEPSRGEVQIRGRVASLLEVGTGFHPELTGRENIFLNGAILGMSRAEIQRKFDEIVDFADVTRFLDTPVKHYSSGMYVRLAFAVAAHLESDVLLVDEVLAVGDAGFQRKCMQKMNEVGKTGRTVLFVSHSMPSVELLCPTSLILDQGSIAGSGETKVCIDRYLTLVGQQIDSTPLRDRKDRKGSQSLRFVDVTVHDDRGARLEQVINGRDVEVRLHYEADRLLSKANVSLAFNVTDSKGTLLTFLGTNLVTDTIFDVARQGYFACRWPHFNLRAGSYTCTLFCEVNGQIVDWIQAAFRLEVEDGDFFGGGKLPPPGQGTVLVAHEWSTSPS